MSNLDIDEITKNQKFQNTTDELIEEKHRQDEAIDELSDYLYKHNADQIEQIIADKNKLNTKEIEYINSPYYYNYQSLLQNLGDTLMLSIYDLVNKYDSNYMFVDNSFVREIETCLYLTNIGFPIPDRFIRNLESAICSKLYELNSIEKTYYTVSIEPREYIRDNDYTSLLKKIDSYQVLIKLKKEKSKTKKK